MTEQEIQTAYRRIIGLLNQKRLKEALSDIKECLDTAGYDWELANRLERTDTSYQYLLQYLRQGIDDPDRHRLYRQLLNETWEIADQMRIRLLDKSCDQMYYHARAMTQHLFCGNIMRECLEVQESYPDDVALCALMPEDKQSLERVVKRYAESIRMLFLSTWGNSQWDSELRECAQAYLKSESLPEHDLCLLIGAVLLSLMECFDMHKFSWLLDACAHPNVQVSQRALVVTAIVIHLHADHIAFYPTLESRLAILADDETFVKGLNRIYIQLLRCQETTKIDKKMREEILPEMMKGWNLMQSKGFDIEDLWDENDSNPDWKKKLRQSDLENKIQEINELQSEGADVHMSSFAQLKGFSFFHDIFNWFYPFFPLHPDIIHEFGLDFEKENKMLASFIQSGFFCNSDKYSLVFMMKRANDNQQQQLLKQMGGMGFNDIMDAETMKRITEYARRPETVSNLYIHDLYRFFKLHSCRKEFHDIFTDEIALHRIPVLKEMLERKELLTEVADFHFRKEHPAEAAEIYQLLENRHEESIETLQKHGYCLQKLKYYPQAIEAYLKADILQPDQLWTIRHLATCYRLMHNYQTALQYYQKAERMIPENHDIWFFTGSCLTELGREEEALQYFFRLDLMEEQCIKAWRAIGWCSFVCDKYGQAMKYYEQVIASRPTVNDYLNAGHVTWVSGNVDKAVEYYHQAYIRCQSKKEFLELFDTDRETLEQKGIPADEIPLVLDMI